MIQRYLLGLNMLGFFLISIIIFIPILETSSFSDLGKNEVFIPMLDLFQVSGASLAILSILSVHPLITDGKETLKMKTPLTHPGIKSSILLVMITAPMYIYLYNRGISEQEWQLDRIFDVCNYLLIISGVTIINIVLVFYVLKWHCLNLNP